MFKYFPLAAVGTLFLAGVGHAQYDPVYYTVDAANDTLCAITVPGGVVTYLGPLGIDVGAVDLAWHQGALYAKTWGTSAGNKICQIVTDGHWLGTALQGQFLTGGGYLAGAEAGGIASDGISLHITYSNGSPTVQYSQLFGDIATIWSGVITQIPRTGPTALDDGDAMGFAGNRFWVIDVKQVATGYDLYSGTVTGGSVTWTVVGNDTYDSSLNPTDVEDYTTQDLVAISQDGLHLVFVNRSTGKRDGNTLVSGLLPNGKLEGIAMKPAPCPRRIIWIP